jgi:hypothetical protein
MKGRFMKKASPVSMDEMRPEYRREDLGKGVRGKYFEEYSKGTNLVLLSPDVAASFPTAEAVNEALRSLVRIAQASTRRSPGLKRRAITKKPNPELGS